MSLTRKMSILLLFVTLFLGSSWTIAQAQTIPATGETQPTVRLIAHRGGQPYGFYPTGQFVYASIGPDFTIIDVSTPLTPTRLGTVTIGGFLSDITVVDHYAWVAGGRAGVHLIDTTVASQPQLLQTFKALGYVIGIARYQDLLLLIYQIESTGQSGLQVVRITDPSHPTTVANRVIPDFRAVDITVKDQYAFIAGARTVSDLNDDGVLRIFDLSEAQSPQRLGDFVDTAGAFRSVTVVDEYAYLAVSFNGIDIVKITDPMQPSLAKANLSTGGSIGYMAALASAKQLYTTSELAQGGGLFQIFDISQTPQLTETARLTDTWLGPVAVSATLAFVANYAQGVQLYNMAATGSPQKLGLFSTQPDFDRYVWAHDSKRKVGAYLYQLTSTEHQFDTLQILDTTQPGTSIEIGTYYVPTQLLQSLAVEDEKIYVSFLDRLGNSRGILLFNQTGPFTGQPAGEIELEGYGEITDLAVIGRYLFFIDNYTVGETNQPRSSLRVADIADLTKPQLLGSYDTRRGLRRMALWNNLAYLLYEETGQGNACRGGLEVLDVTVVDQLKYLGEVCGPWAPYGIIAEDGYALIAGGNNGLRVVDVVVPAAPKEAASTLLSQGAGRIAKSGEQIAIDDWLQGLYLFQFQAPVITKTITDATTLLVPFDGTTYTFTPNAIGLSSRFTHTVRYVDDTKAFPPPLLGIGHYFMNAIAVSNQGWAMNAIQPYTVTITYRDEEIRMVEEQTLALYYWNGTEWQPELSSQVDVTKNQIKAKPERMGVWGVGGRFLAHSYLPITRN